MLEFLFYHDKMRFPKSTFVRRSNRTMGTSGRLFILLLKIIEFTFKPAYSCIFLTFNHMSLTTLHYLLYVRTV